jgi:hypothetical protein
MSIGFPATKADWDSRLGQFATALASDLYNWNQLFIRATSSLWGSSGLQAIGYTAAEATAVINACTDLGGSGISLFNVAHGGTLPAGPNDFFFNAKQLTGVVGIGF